MHQKIRNKCTIKRRRDWTNFYCVSYKPDWVYGVCVGWPDLTISGSSNWIPAKITQPIYKTCYSHTCEYSHLCTRASISNTRARTRTRIFTTRTGSLLAFLVLVPSRLLSTFGVLLKTLGNTVQAWVTTVLLVLPGINGITQFF